VLDLFGEHPARVSTTTVGAEQEYFLISEKDYAEAPGPHLTGRTLFGAPPRKGQELEEHYFGAIRPTVNEFMKELDDELWKLGVSAKTKHNEVAPRSTSWPPSSHHQPRRRRQPADHGEDEASLAPHHGLVCLQHEKPFEGVNGSGKHNNWSISAGKRTCWIPATPPWTTCSSWCS
jgi:glutamine synthetase